MCEMARKYVGWWSHRASGACQNFKNRKCRDRGLVGKGEMWFGGTVGRSKFENESRFDEKIQDHSTHCVLYLSLLSLWLLFTVARLCL